MGNRRVGRLRVRLENTLDLNATSSFSSSRSRQPLSCSSASVLAKAPSAPRAYSHEEIGSFCTTSPKFGSEYETWEAEWAESEVGEGLEEIWERAVSVLSSFSGPICVCAIHLYTRLRLACPSSVEHGRQVDLHLGTSLFRQLRYGRRSKSSHRSRVLCVHSGVKLTSRSC